MFLHWSPFHPLFVWRPDLYFWDRVSWSDLGGVILVGHRSQRKCLFRTETRRLTVVHETGVDDMNFQFCQCEAPPAHEVHAAQALQLLRSGLWPASWVQPSPPLQALP